ncbi:MAG: hypothetical protein J7L88_03395 [Thermoplasmata archaeon]|nr:hypothetical protein [Thermoplasmata archaeon]
MTFLALLSLDIIRSFRKGLKSIKRAPVITAWFLVLIVVGESFLLMTHLYGGGGMVGKGITAGRVIILLALFFTVKTSYHFRREVLQEGPFQIMYTTPRGASILKWEKLAYMVLLNYLLFLLFLIPFTILSLLLEASFRVTPEGVVLLVLLPLLSTASGSTLASSRHLLHRANPPPLY